MNPSKPKRSASLLNGQLKVNIRLWPWLVILAILIILPYAQIKSHDFIIWDDPYYIYNNPVVASGLSKAGIAWAFTTGITANWHPLTWISHMLDVSLFGPTPAAAHMINILWYLGCVILIFFLFLRLGASSAAAFFMAAFFGVHPLHVESVAWASERKDLLCAFFFLSSTLLYLRYARERKMSFYFLTTLAFMLSLLSKPMAVTWPFVALLLDYWPLKRFGIEFKKVFYEKIPWFILTICSSIITIIVQNKNEAVKPLTDFSITDRLANAVISYAIYIRQSFWPSDLTVFYPYPYQISNISFITSGIILGLITFVTLKQRKKHPYLLWGWLFYLGVLFPTIGLIQVGGQAHADRYTLLPQLGLILGLGLFLDKSMKKINIRQIVLWMMMLMIIILTGLTFRQVSYWKNNQTLFDQNLAVAGENELAHFNLGAAYLEKNELDLAVIHLSAAAGMNPSEITTYNNLGIAYFRQNKLSLAESCFRKAIFINSTIASPHFHLAVIKIKQGNLDEAIRHLDEAVRLAPDWLTAKQLRDEVKNSPHGNSTKNR